MFEKILQKLKDTRGKNVNVSDRTLEDLARSMETLVSTDELLESADFSKAIESIEGNISHIAAKQVSDLKKKAKPSDPPKNEGGADPNEPTNDDPNKGGNDVPSWAKSLIESNKSLSAQVASLTRDKQNNVRLDRLNKVLGETPDFYKKPIMKTFDKMSFEDEDDFNAYVTSIEEERKGFEQTMKEKGLKFGIPTTPPQTPQKETGQTKELQGAMEVLKKQKEKQNN